MAYPDYGSLKVIINIILSRAGIFLILKVVFDFINRRNPWHL